MTNLQAEIGSTTYPGRGIVIGTTPDGKYAACAYFIMGRSENSRNRVFVEDGEGIRTQAFDPSKMEDPSLIIYAPVRVLGNSTIVTNGDQTDTIYDFFRDGKTFEEALRTRDYEPDAPHYTPRISAVINKSAMSFKHSILKRDGKFFFEYKFEPGFGRLIHTYDHDVTPDKTLPSFSGEPRKVKIPDNLEEFSEKLWQELGEDYRVALYVRFYEKDFSGYKDKLFNRLVD